MPDARRWTSLPLLVTSTAYRLRRDRRRVLGRLHLDRLPVGRVPSPIDLREQALRDRDLRARLDPRIPTRQPRQWRSGADPDSAVGARVLHLVTNALPQVQAGYTLRTQHVLRAQRALGIDAAAVTSPGFPVMQGHLAARWDDVDGVRYHHLLSRILPDVTSGSYVRQLCSAAVRHRVDLLQATSDYVNARAALEAGAELGLPVAYEVRGFLEDSWASRCGDPDAYLSDRYRTARLRETEAMLAADVVVTLGKGMRDELIDRDIDPARIVIVPNAVDDAFLAPLVDASAARRTVGLAEHALTVGVITTVHAFEGVPVAIRACEIARSAGIEVGLVIVGDGPVMPAVQEAASTRPWVRLTGRVSRTRVRDWFDAIDVLAVPREDHRVTRLVTPLKPLEALARGRVVLASDLPALREVVGGHGRFAPPGDPIGWAEALAELQEAGIRHEIARPGRDWVARERRWIQVSRTYMSAYSSILGARASNRADGGGR